MLTLDNAERTALTSRLDAPDTAPDLDDIADAKFWPIVWPLVRAPVIAGLNAVTMFLAIFPALLTAVAPPVFNEALNPFIAVDATLLILPTLPCRPDDKL